MNKSLNRKFNVPAPRYTSYPGMSDWNPNPPSEDAWKKNVSYSFTSTNGSDGISLYIHLPFCESLCTYCDCNTKITVNHKVEVPYIKSVLKEWQMYLAVFKTKPNIAEIHIGGGTPTFFNPKNLKMLIDGIKSEANILTDAVLGFEAHPNSATKAHMEVLYDLGFTKLNLGIQDFDIQVQKAANRVQSFEIVKSLVDEARAIGYSSINFDLIYGLPHQTIDTVKDTIEKVNALKPDRIAFYSYTHMPWINSGQRKYNQLDLLEDNEKRELYELGKEMFEAMGYLEVGMDNFSLPSDGLYLAIEKGSLHRNFMGYTTKHSRLMIGLGVSSISDSWEMFTQNVNTIEGYQKLINEGVMPILKGHKLSLSDKITRRQMLELMCGYQTRWHPFNDRNIIEYKLNKMIEDHLVTINSYGVTITSAGKPFVRNVCMAFDEYLGFLPDQSQSYNKTV